MRFSKLRFSKLRFSKLRFSKLRFLQSSMPSNTRFFLTLVSYLLWISISLKVVVYLLCITISFHLGVSKLQLTVSWKYLRGENPELIKLLLWFVTMSWLSSLSASFNTSRILWGRPSITFHRFYFLTPLTHFCTKGPFINDLSVIFLTIFSFRHAF